MQDLENLHLNNPVVKKNYFEYSKPLSLLIPQSYLEPETNLIMTNFINPDLNKRRKLDFYKFSFSNRNSYPFFEPSSSKKSGRGIFRSLYLLIQKAQQI